MQSGLYFRFTRLEFPLAATSIIACKKKKHFSSLFTAGYVSCEGTSVTQRQKFHTDDVKSVLNQVSRSTDWSTELIHYFSYCWQTNDKRPQRLNVNVMNLSQYLWNLASKGSIWVLLELVHGCTQHFTKIDQEKRKIEQICIWNSMTTRFVMKTFIYVTNIEFCCWDTDVPLCETFPVVKSEEKRLFSQAMGMTLFLS